MSWPEKTPPPGLLGLHDHGVWARRVAGQLSHRLLEQPVHEIDEAISALLAFDMSAQPFHSSVEKRIADLEASVESLIDRCSNIEQAQSSARNDVLVGALWSFLIEHLKTISDVEAVFLRKGNLPEVIVVLSGPVPSEDKVYEVLETCLFTFTELSFDSVVLYRRNVPDLTVMSDVDRTYLKR